MSENNYYIVDVHGGIEPDLSGPYATAADRDTAARQVHREQSDDDATFWLDIALIDGKPPIVDIGSYSGAFFHDERDGDAEITGGEA